MPERIEGLIIVGAAIGFTLLMFVGSVGVGLFGFGLLLFGFGSGLIYLALSLAGLAFTGLLVGRVLIPFVRLVAEEPWV